MSTPTELLARWRIPSHSYVAAAQAAGALRAECDLPRYNEMLSELAGTGVHLTDYPTAQMTFGYYVQELVRSLNGQPVNRVELLEIATEKATQFVKREPWHWGGEDAAGKVTRIEEIKRFVSIIVGVDRNTLAERVAEEFEITKSTAATYIRQLDKDDEPETVIEKKPAAPKINKGAEAAKLVEAHFNGSNKREMLDMIVEQLNTSRGGAQTFFYAALKNLNLSVAKTTNKTSEPSTQDRLKAIFTATPSIDKAGFIDAAEKMGIKRSTAQTYYYSLTSNMGVERKGTGSRGRKKVGEQSRADQVRDFVAANPTLSKTELIEALSAHFTVSKLSAQSYYYAARKATK